MMALLLICSLPVSAFAEEYDLSVGSVTVNASESRQTVSQVNGVQNHTETTPTVITQTGSENSTTNTVTITAEEKATASVTIQDVNIVISDPADAPPVDHSGEAAITIDVADGAEANVTLDGVDIDVSGTGGLIDDKPIPGEAAVQITGNGDVTMELDGENTVQGGQNRAGVEKNSGGNLTIIDENETHGSLEATGGKYGSGIGGGIGGDGSNITITGCRTDTRISQIHQG